MIVHFLSADAHFLDAGWSVRFFPQAVPPLLAEL